MTATLDTVLQAAMQLSDSERSQLVDALVPSIADRFVADSPLTRAELDERWVAYQHSGSKGLSWEDVRLRG